MEGMSIQITLSTLLNNETTPSKLQIYLWKIFTMKGKIKTNPLVAHNNNDPHIISFQKVTKS